MGGLGEERVLGILDWLFVQAGLAHHLWHRLLVVVLGHEAGRGRPLHADGCVDSLGCEVAGRSGRHNGGVGGSINAALSSALVTLETSLKLTKSSLHAMTCCENVSYNAGELMLNAKKKNIRYVRWATRFWILFFSLGSLTLVQSSSSLNSPLRGKADEGIVAFFAEAIVAGFVFHTSVVKDMAVVVVLWLSRSCWLIEIDREGTFGSYALELYWEPGCRWKRERINNGRCEQML